MKPPICIIRFTSLAFVLLASTTQAAVLKNYTDHQVVPGWAQTGFEALLKAGVISGTDDKKLNPNTTINRAEFAKILLNAADKPLIKPHSNSFTDVHPTQWFYPYIETATQLGWVQGYDDGSFRPGNQINRAEMAKLINQAFAIPAPSQPTDTAWYQPYVRALAAKNLLPYNVSASAFGAERFPTRAEAFEQIYRAMQFKYTTTAAPSNPSQIVENNTDPFDIPANFNLTMAVTPSAGRLDLKRPDHQAQKVLVTPGQNQVTIAQLELVARGGPVTLSDLQFRRIGNGNTNDFAHLWLEANNQTLTEKIKPVNDLVVFNFQKPLLLPSNQIQVLNLKADMASQATIGNSQRFVLYLPDWINANTNEKIGLFPLGGSNIETREP